MKLYNRQKLVNHDVEAIRANMIYVVDKSIRFWTAKHETHIADGDAHGRLAAGQVLSSLSVIREQMQEF